MTTPITAVMMSLKAAAASVEAPGTMTLERETMAQREIGSPSDALLASAADTQNGTIAGANQEHHRAGGVWGPERTSPRPASGPTRARRTPAEQAERRRLERDLHDSVQNELVSLLVKLTLIEEDPDTPPALADKIASVGAHATAALDSVREITLGVPPLLLARFGVLHALRAQVKRAAVDVRLQGTAPRSTEEAEVAMYFSCLEAIQNVAKHAGRDVHVTLRLQHNHGRLTVRIGDDGVGFDPAQTPPGAGLRNIHDRIQTMGGSVGVTSRPGRGTLLTMSLPWPPRHRGPSTEPRSGRGQWAK